ncbi:MAG: hypothetical protein ACO3EP_04290, partial [Phycisphaerales bacterium]
MPRDSDLRSSSDGGGDSDAPFASRARGGVVASLVVTIATLSVAGFLASRTGSETGFSPIEPIAAFAVGVLPALLWLGFAGGLAVPASKLLPPHLVGSERMLAALALGVGLAMWIDAVLGRLGILTLGDGIAAWTIAVLGAAGLLGPLRRASWRPPRLAWRDLTLATPLATLAVAAIAAPGWLWASEFGGYDALSYHLQLPKEWLGLGVLEPLGHNVYSHLPSHVEASTLHLMAMLRDPLDAAIPAQCLQALLAVATAALLATTARRLAGANAVTPAGFVAAGAFLGTPWIVVTGSLAYSEMAVCLPFAAGLAVLLRRPSEANAPRSPQTETIAIALLAATAIGAKATAIGFVALPLGVLLLASTPPRRWWIATVLGLLVGLVVLSPWLWHNTVSAGQPFFPLLANALGGGGWSDEQREIFAAAHGPDASPWSAFVAEALLHGLGPAPDAGEPWRPQWSLLWMLGLAAIAVLAIRPAWRGIAGRLGLIVGVNVVFWAAVTHLESRFLIPAAVPLAMATGLATVDLRRPIERGLLVLAVLVWGLVPAAIFLRERPVSEADRWGSPAAATGRIAALSGDLHIRLLRDPGLSREARGEVLETAPPWTFINDPSLTGADGKVLLLGEARPFYLRRTGEYATVWDRGRVSSLVRAHPDDPARWRRELAEAGFTLLLVDRNMIDRWRRDGWWDGALDAETIDRLLEALVPMRRFAYGLELFAIREPATPAGGGSSPR